MLESHPNPKVAYSVGTILVVALAVGAFLFVRSNNDATKPIPVVTPAPKVSPKTSASALASPTPTATATPTPTSTPVTYSKSSDDSALSFEYPSTATLINADTFTNGGITYSIETPTPGGKTSIESWLQDANVSYGETDLTKYTKTMVAGKTAYTYTGELRTYVMSSNKIYELVARNSVAPSTDSNDSVYTHFLSSLSFK